MGKVLINHQTQQQQIITPSGGTAVNVIERVLRPFPHKRGGKARPTHDEEEGYHTDGHHDVNSGWQIGFCGCELESSLKLFSDGLNSLYRQMFLF